MPQLISAQEIINTQSVIVDVRSEGEFAEAHIPGSISLPILNDAERAEIGTLYKRVSPEAARRRGVEIVRPKLSDFYRKFSELSKASAVSKPPTEILEKHFQKVITELWGSDFGNPDSSDAPQALQRQTPMGEAQLTFYCWRGGARSQSMAHLAHLMGFKVQFVEGGHKAFRRHVLEYLNAPQYPFKFCTLYGLTGAGKTRVLQQWLKEGKPIIDLEDLAHHRGSAFGQMGIDIYGRQKDFENNLFWQMRLLEKRGEKFIIVEGESRRIGRCSLPENFFQAMQAGTHVQLTCSLEKRVAHILSEYFLPLEESRLQREVRSSLDAIKKRLGGELHKSLLLLFEKKDYALFIQELLVHYYDKKYALSQAPEGAYAAVIESTADWPVIITSLRPSL